WEGQSRGWRVLVIHAARCTESPLVMAGLVPAIHVFEFVGFQDVPAGYQLDRSCHGEPAGVDARHKAGHDGGRRRAVMSRKRTSPVKAASHRFAVFCQFSFTRRTSLT